MNLSLSAEIKLIYCADSMNEAGKQRDLGCGNTGEIFKALLEAKVLVVRWKPEYNTIRRKRNGVLGVSME